jgi:hypothetical protein
MIATYERNWQRLIVQDVVAQKHFESMQALGLEQPSMFT